NTASPTRGAVPAAVVPVAGAADEVTGGAAAPDEEHGFGHGVDGLSPAKELPNSGSVAPHLPPESGGATAPADAPAQAPAASAATVDPAR
ncbi:MAG TPA: hypothetical protein VGV67_03530, partial [Solirubrobacteraceae bacterium]|nr:hypothetical protein [Solirubrobacteraceae bacterium]